MDEKVAQLLGDLLHLDRVTVARLRMLPDQLAVAGVGLGVGGCPGARRPVSVLLTYNEAGQIAMLRLLSPDESAPW